LNTNCTNCNSLSKAIKGQNYCSVNGDTIQSVTSNAYYFKANALCSGKHISRLSIRTISDGYQHHKVDKRDIILDKDNYLVLNEGEAFYSQISTNKAIEGLVVAFNSSDISAMNKMDKGNFNSLLDDPFHYSKSDTYLRSQQFILNSNMKTLLNILKQNMRTGYDVSIFYQELFGKIFESVRKDYQKTESKVNNIKAKKVSTRIEIVRRISIVKEYIDAHFDEDISLQKLAQVATMSPYHLLRSFKSFFQVTPHQYLIAKRLKKAKFLLWDTDDGVRTITKSVGFQNNSSFIRLFKANMFMTPLEYRNFRRRVIFE